MQNFILTEKDQILNLDHIVSLNKHEREDHAWIDAQFADGNGMHIAFSKNKKAIDHAWFDLKKRIDPIETFLLNKQIVEEEDEK